VQLLVEIPVIDGARLAHAFVPASLANPARFAKKLVWNFVGMY